MGCGHASSGAAHLGTLALPLQTTRRHRFYTASAIVLPPASSHLPGPCCSCHSCCCKPSEGVCHTRPKDWNWAEEAGAGTLTCLGVPPEAPVLGTTPTTCTSCHPAASKLVSIKGFNPKEVGSAIPGLHLKGMGREVGTVLPLPFLPLSQRKKL